MKKIIAVSFCIVILLMGGFNFALFADYVSPLAATAGQTVILEGRVISVKEKTNDFYKLEVETSDEKILCSIKGALNQPWNLVGRRLSIQGISSLPPSARNPKTFDYQLYLKTIGIHMLVSVDAHDVKVSNEALFPMSGRWILNKMSYARSKFIERMMENGDETVAGLMAGMIFGEKSYIEEDIYEDFQKNGTAHILAVSGIHVAIVYGFVNLITGKRRSLLKTLLTFTLLIMYAALSGFSISVMRAVLMIMLHLFSQIISKRYDLISAACFTALIFLIINPYTLYNAGFLLSYIAVLSLSVIGDFFMRTIKFREGIKKVVVPIAAIQTGMIPITAYLFNYFSASAFVANIPIIAISGMIIPVGIIMMPLAFLNGIGAEIFDAAMIFPQIAVKLMMFLNELTGVKGYGYFNVVSPSLWMIIAYYTAGLLLFSEIWVSFKGIVERKIILGLMLILLSFSVVISGIEQKMQPQIIFLDVGQGDCIIIRTPCGKNILIDGGGTEFGDYDVGKKVLLPYLLKNGIYKIDVALISHMDADHYKGAESISKEISIKNIVFSSDYVNELNTLSEKFSKEVGDIAFMRAGDKLIVEEGIYMTALWPSEKKTNSDQIDENSKSLVLMLNYENKKILLTGDIPKAIEENLAGKIKADIVKVPHHGSNGSSGEAFLDRIDPAAAVIQVGKNQFGHPAPSVVERYQKKGIIVFRNDQDGAVCVWIKNGKVTMKTTLNGEKYEL